jgi:murein DD-endopeptidase MepM/ murein hydrolase activator NlpD
VVCVGESCGLAAGSGNGLGIAIRYDSCNCVVFYTHLATINEGLTVDSSVVRGIEIGTSGTDVTGYPHLHLEIRPKHDVLTFYNPLYFFSRQALRLIPNDFMAYEGASNEWRIYGYTSSLDHRFIGSFWDKTLPALWVRR